MESRVLDSDSHVNGRAPVPLSVIGRAVICYGKSAV